jgi:TRAP-type C4-dicarboxylate transport system substrate-binding protein
MTRHSWICIYSGFNLPAWKKLPPEIQDIIGHHLTEAATLERADWQRLDETEKKTLQDHGMIFNEPDVEPFRALARKNGFYVDMKKRMGDEAWALLEKYTGKLA